jgi:DNA helicase HerA-like ATPase
MAYEKLLILESAWSDDIADSRETREIYASLETLLSLQDDPMRIIQRPLISSRYIDDINQFVSLESNRKGPNVVVLSAHGSYDSNFDNKGKLKHTRQLTAWDGDVNISRDIRKIEGNLSRTIFVLDACEIGTEIKSFRAASGALGIIGFSESVDWIDSSVFVLALLLRLQKSGVFQMERARPERPKNILDEMRNGHYKSLMDSLKVEYAFA